MTAPGCAAVRAAEGEPLHASAPVAASSWLLLEHPGPWPAGGMPADLPAEVAGVVARAKELGVRPQLVRRVDERRSPSPLVAVASVRRGSSWLERRAVPDLRAVTDLDLDALAAGQRPGFGEPDDGPLLLVCTNGRRDVCCARLGRPMAVLLDRQLPGRVWETTHLGGDRFAPNVVALPDGSYHGDVRPAEVPALADAVTSGRVLLPRWRGRAGVPAAVQAAEHFLRVETGDTALDAVEPVAAHPQDDDVTCVELLLSGVRWCVHVRLGPGAAPRLTTCKGGGQVTSPRSYALLEVRRLG